MDGVSRFVEDCGLELDLYNVGEDNVDEDDGFILT